MMPELDGVSIAALASVAVLLVSWLFVPASERKVSTT